MIIYMNEMMYRVTYAVIQSDFKTNNLSITTAETYEFTKSIEYFGPDIRIWDNNIINNNDILSDNIN